MDKLLSLLKALCYYNGKNVPNYEYTFYINNHLYRFITYKRFDGLLVISCYVDGFYRKIPCDTLIPDKYGAISLAIAIKSKSAGLNVNLDVEVFWGNRRFDVIEKPESYKGLIETMDIKIKNTKYAVRWMEQSDREDLRKYIHSLGYDRFMNGLKREVMGRL